ncbi:Riboflavin synthase [subsurface metagenome]
MFTGLIEMLCTVKSVRNTAGVMQLTVDLGKLADETKVGDSIAINGVCLTVTQLTANVAGFDVSPETLTKSALGKLKTGSQVNVEQAIKAGDRLGGHIVAGHIDGTATIAAVHKQDKVWNIKFSAPSELLDQMVVKGSVAVDGISLTIASLDKGSFGAAIIPETLKKTTLGQTKIGDSVNVETDIIVKIIKKQLDKILPQKQNLTVEKMKELGF